MKCITPVQLDSSMIERAQASRATWRLCPGPRGLRGGITKEVRRVEAQKREFSKRPGGMEMTFQMVSGACAKEVRLELAWYDWEF